MFLETRLCLCSARGVPHANLCGVVSLKSLRLREIEPVDSSREAPVLDALRDTLLRRERGGPGRLGEYLITPS
jgi:hypothetical protein